jgi:hypothetical protein
MDEVNARARRFAIGLALITVAGAVVALWHLGRESLWMDEAVSLAFARASWLAVPFRDNGNGALYLVFLKGWAHFFSSESGIRMLSLVPFVATIPVVGLLGRRIVGPVAGLVAAAVFATNADALFWARAARGYSLEVFLTALGMLLLLVGVDERRRDALVAAVLLGACAAWVQPIAAVAFVFLVASLWLLPEGTLPVAPGALLALLVVLVAPLAIALATAGTSQISWLGSGGFSHLPAIVLNMAGGHQVGIPIAILATIGAVVAFRDHRDDVHTADAWRVAAPIVCVLGTLLVIVAVSVRQSLIDEAYILLLLPSVAVLVGLGVTSIRWRHFATAVAATTVVASVAIFLHHDSAGGEDIRGAEAAIAARAQPGDVIVLNPTPLAGGFEFYLDQRPTSFPDPAVPPGTWGSLPVNNQPDLNGQYLDLVAKTAGRPRVWFVQRLNGSPTNPDAVRAMLSNGRTLVERIELPKLTIELYALASN